MDRQDLIQLLTNAMQGRVDDGVLGGRLREGQVKSRLVEAHPPEASSDGSHSLLASVAKAADLDLLPLSEDLWVLLGAEDAFFVDALNPRFWLLHSTARTQTVTSLWRKHIVSSAALDSAWLTAEQLRELEGERRWIKSSFSSDELQPNEAVVPRRWRVQVEGDAPDDLLAMVSESPKYRASASLTAVASILRDEQLGTARVAADYQGGFVSSGSSFEVVIGLLWRSLDRYEGYVRDLESRFQLKSGAIEESSADVSDGVALTFEGDVAQLDFPHRVSDLETFVGNLFNCREPFRLWAVPREVGESQWEANAVDLHVGHTLRLEITPDWMRILLGERTCGNTLARLVANLQHRFDARTRLEPAIA